jgi:hypothetical protein
MSVKLENKVKALKRRNQRLMKCCKAQEKRLHELLEINTDLAFRGAELHTAVKMLLALHMTGHPKLDETDHDAWHYAASLVVGNKPTRHLLGEGR